LPSTYGLRRHATPCRRIRGLTSTALRCLARTWRNRPGIFGSACFGKERRFFNSVASPLQDHETPSSFSNTVARFFRRVFPGAPVCCIPQELLIFRMLERLTGVAVRQIAHPAAAELIGPTGRRDDPLRGSTLEQQMHTRTVGDGHMLFVG